MELHFPEITFAAAHYIPGHGKCGGIHGHTYFVRDLVVSARARSGPWYRITTDGMLLDFGIIKKYFEEEWDHKFIVPEADEEMWQGIPSQGPGHSNLKLLKFTTCEYMACIIRDELVALAKKEMRPDYGHYLDGAHVSFGLYEGPHQGVKV